MWSSIGTGHRDAYPAEKVSLRSASEENFVVVDTTKRKEEVIAEVDFTGAHTTLYEGAVYLCESELYTVEKLDYPNRQSLCQEDAWGLLYRCNRLYRCLHPGRI